jgi:hypothetical protein
MKGKLTKIDIQSRIYKLKTALYDGKHKDKGEDWHNGAHAALNSVLDILQEYRL